MMPPIVLNWNVDYAVLRRDPAFRQVAERVGAWSADPDSASDDQLKALVGEFVELVFRHADGEVTQGD